MDTQSTITHGQVSVVAEALRNFGYRVGDDYVREHMEALSRGEAPKGIIGMFVRDWMRKAKMLP